MPFLPQEEVAFIMMAHVLSYASSYHLLAFVKIVLVQKITVSCM